MYIVNVDADATQAQRDSFTKYLRDQRLGFWHHIVFSWIVTDIQGKTNVRQMRDQVRALMPDVRSLIVQITPHAYAGRSPKAGHEWTRNFLGSDKERWESDKGY